MGKRVGRHRKQMARDMKRGGDGYGKKKKTGGGKGMKSRADRIKMAEDALGDMPL